MCRPSNAAPIARPTPAPTEIPTEIGQPPIRTPIVSPIPAPMATPTVVYGRIPAVVATPLSRRCFMASRGRSSNLATAELAAGSRRQWAADRALRPAMRSPGRPEPSRAVERAFGGWSLAGPAARTRPSGWACRHRWEVDGSDTLAGCPRSAWPTPRAATCHSPSGRTSRCSTCSASGCVRSRGPSAGTPRRSRASCAATQPPGPRSGVTGLGLPSGRRSRRPSVPSRPSSRRTRSFAPTSNSACPARCEMPRAARSRGRTCPGPDAGTAGAWTAAGAPRGAGADQPSTQARLPR